MVQIKVFFAFIYLAAAAAIVPGAALPVPGNQQHHDGDKNTGTIDRHPVLTITHSTQALKRPGVSKCSMIIVNFCHRYPSQVSLKDNGPVGPYYYPGKKKIVSKCSMVIFNFVTDIQH